MIAVACALLGGALLSVAAFWARAPGPGAGKLVELRWPAQTSAPAAAELLHRAGVIASPRLFALYLRVVRPNLDFEPGSHLLNDALSPKQVVQRLARLPARPSARVTIPEGWNHVQIAERLQAGEVCTSAGFVAAVRSKPLLQELGIAGPTAEGYLFPSTYELSVDTSPEQVVRVLVREVRRRLDKLRISHRAAMEQLRAEFGWTEHEILTLASIIEKESGAAEELKLVASVFYNRLRSPDFRPRGTLQSDPTAAYGCVVEPDVIPSCAGYSGRVTPALLRDAVNRYNTYRRPGLPPGPIANPGEAAVVAVLDPAATDYLFFFASGGRRHTFTRTFEEHRNAVRGKTAKSPDDGPVPAPSP